MFKHHRYPKIIILQAVYFKLRFTLSYRDVEELMQIRGVNIDHSTIQRWLFKFSPEVEKNMHRRKHQEGNNCRMDETYIHLIDSSKDGQGNRLRNIDWNFDK